MADLQKLISTDEAAKVTGLSVRTWERLRVSGGGCPFVKLGKRIMYRPSDVEAWIASRVKTSTSA